MACIHTFHGHANRASDVDRDPARPNTESRSPSKPRSHLEGMEGPVPAGGGGADREGFGGGARSVRPAAGVPWPETGRPPGRGDGGACLP